MTLALKMKTDEQISREWQEIREAQRDPASFRPLYDRHFKPVFLFIFKRTGSEETTADLTSQVFLKAMQHLPQYEFRGVPFSAWLYRIATNALNQHFRNAATQRVVSVQGDGLKGISEEMEEDDFEAKQEAVVQAMEELEHEEVMLLEMRFFEHRPFAEVAQILDITENNAKVRMHRVISKIRKIITKKGYYNG